MAKKKPVELPRGAKYLIDLYGDAAAQAYFVDDQGPLRDVAPCRKAAAEARRQLERYILRMWRALKRAESKGS